MLQRITRNVLGLLMISAHFLEYLALAVALLAMAAVVAEIAVKDRSLFGRILRGTEVMAARAKPRPLAMIDTAATTNAPANTNEAHAAVAA